MRPYNFSAGPSMLPEEVLMQIREDIPNWKSGISVMEWSHRTTEIEQLFEEAKALLTQALGIPNHYEILLMHGGARGQFAAIPMNFADPQQKTHYWETGYWSGLAAKEAALFSDVTVSTLSSPVEIDKAVAYLHYTDNETIDGIEFLTDHQPMDLAEVRALGVPVIADMTSSILSKPVTFGSRGMIYAGCQKNLGIAGLTVALIDKALIEQSRANSRAVPSILDYRKVMDAKSMGNTPPVFAVYVLSLVLKWVAEQGGLAGMSSRRETRSKVLYQAIDKSEIFENTVPTEIRSQINIPFKVKSHFSEKERLEIENKFKLDAKARGLIKLEGHKVSGGFRASMYNAMPIEGAKLLADCIEAFVG